MAILLHGLKGSGPMAVDRWTNYAANTLLLNPDVAVGSGDLIAKHSAQHRVVLR